MTFASPHLLWLLLVPALLFAWDFRRRRRTNHATHPKILQAEAGAQHLSLVARPSPVARSRPWLFAGLVLALVAFARPQWGRLEEPVFDQSREILIAIDLSRSMMTPDVKPSRLERAKLLTQSLLEKLAGERVGLIVFSGTAFLQSPLSSDYEILREFLPVLGPNFMPEGGTNYGALLDTAIGAFGSSTSADRFLIVLSDGEATDDNWRDRAEELKQKGIRVIALGVGTATGGMIPDGSGGLVKDERGAVVLSKLESGTLRELADLTGGTYRDASSWIDLASVLNATVDAGRKGKFLEKNTVRLVERFQWPLAFGLWCLLVSFYYEFPVRPRPRDIRLTSTPKSRQPTAASLAGAALILLLLPSLAPPLRAAKPASSAHAAPTPPLLAKIVGRLASQPSATARDWAELAGETVRWGQKIQSTQQPVPPGPVHDALTAVDLGSALDAKTADWPKLRSDLEALLKKPEDQKQDQQQNQKNQDQKNQDQQKQDQQKQDENQQQDQSKQDSQQQQKKDQSQQQKDQQQQKQDQSKPEKPSDQKNSESAFGDMKDHNQPPPPPPGESQKVGGVPEKKESEKNPTDPAMAMPLQKLGQLRDKDSPAELFQLMDADTKPSKPKKNAKDW